MKPAGKSVEEMTVWELRRRIWELRAEKLWIFVKYQPRIQKARARLWWYRLRYIVVLLRTHSLRVWIRLLRWKWYNRGS